MQIIQGDKFKKEFKKFLKKYHSLQEDFDLLEKVIRSSPAGDESKHWNRLKQDGSKYILKMRMMCRAVKGSSFRVIYYYDGASVELIFIEIYFKGQKSSEDIQRIEDFWKQRTRV